jgi:DNA polymerase-3 subunit delta'
MNALLKTLESPPASCVFILQSRTPHRLLPTIKSRCQHWHIATPQAQQYQQWLAQQKLLSLPPLYNQLCLGAPLQLKAFVDEKRDKAFESMLQTLLDFMRLDFALPKPFVDAVATNTLDQLQLLSIALIELQKSYYSEQVSVTEHNLLSQLQQQLTYQQVFELTETLLTLVEQLTVHTGLNKELLISQWLIQTKI